MTTDAIRRSGDCSVRGFMAAGVGGPFGEQRRSGRGSEMVEEGARQSINLPKECVMEKGRRLLFWAGILMLFAATSVICLEAGGLDALAKADREARADIVMIDAMARSAKLELPAVTFYHDQHTEALTKQGKDCAACHLKDEGGKMSLKYMRLADEGQDLKKLYHDGCIGCHKDMVSTGQKSGPLDGQCRACHTKRPSPSDWVDIAMDKSLHYRHVAASGGEGKCGTCHHVYDDVAKKVVEAKGKEQNCRNCHMEEATTLADGTPVRSYAEASHQSCVACHMDVAAMKKNSGPAKCGGCHAVESQAAYSVVEKAPRLMRGQPDVTLLVAYKDGKPMANIGPVPFNHEKHEGYADSCRSCHVGSGSMDGKYFELAGDSHLISNMTGCMGCHKAEQEKDPVCAGCHAMMPVNKEPDPASCAKCHNDSLKALYADGREPAKAVVDAAASAALAVRDVSVATIADAEITDLVTIDYIQGEYGPSVLPHRKIVKSLIKSMQGDALAGHFHGQETLMCQGCHHNSPASKTPPKCVSCHSEAFNPAKPDVPGLKAAFHGQCMGCHTAMKLEKPVNTTCSDADGCHVKKQ